jgi:hypothetical protein
MPPIYAELHDGRRLEFPEGTDPAVIQQTVKKVLGLQAAQTAPAEAPSGLMKGLNDVSSAGAQLLANSLPDSVVNAVNTATRKVNQLPVIGPITQMLGMVPATAAELNQQVTETGKNYEQARKAFGQTGFDWSRAAGQAIGAAPLATALPAAGPGMLSRAGVGFLSGAMGGAVTPVESGDFWSEKAKQVGVGGTVGAVMTPILGAVLDKVSNGVANFFANRKPVSVEEINSVIRENLRASGQRWEDLSPKIQSQLREQTMSALAGKGKFDPAALARKADFESEGMQGTLGQITRDPRQFATERNLRTLPGTGDPLLQRFQSQGQQLQQKMEAYAGGATSDKALAGEKIADALKAYDAKQSSAVTAAYKAARETAGKDAEVPMQGLAQDVADIFDRYRTAVPSGIQGQFAKYGLNPAEVTNQRKLFTVEEADKLLKEINKQGSTEPAVQSALSELRNAVKRAVTQDAGVEDVFSPARKLAAQRFASHEAIPALEAAATGKVAPDDFLRRYLINGKSADVGELAAILKQSPEALQEARSQVGAYLQRSAYGENVAGDKAFSPERYAKALRELGDSKLAAFFEPGEIAQLHRLGRIGAYMESIPNASPVQHSNNWGAIMSAVTRIPGVPMALAAGKAAKTAVGNQLAVSQALAGKVPVQSNLDPETVKLLSRLLTTTGVVTGAAVAPNQ